MSDYIISEIRDSDTRSRKKQQELLIQEGIDRDGHLDYSVGLFDDDYNIVATGSCYRNTLRCMAVSSNHQGEGLMNEVVSHLTEKEMERGYRDLFLYTKVKSAKFFNDLGFYEIARVEDHLVFMENKRDGFQSYLCNLEKEYVEGDSIAAIVMNANPFTLGHRYLVEKAARENDVVHLFVVSEDISEVPFSIRYDLVKKGVADLDNVYVHESGDYIISSATFPSYFLKEEGLVAKTHARLDIEIFKRIARTLNITRRYVGTEPLSVTTNLYNEVMKKELNTEDLECVVVPRKENESGVISASKVRELIKESNFAELKKYVPATTYDYYAK